MSSASQCSQVVCGCKNWCSSPSSRDQHVFPLWFNIWDKKMRAVFFYVSDWRVWITPGQIIRTFPTALEDPSCLTWDWTDTDREKNVTDTGLFMKQHSWGFFSHLNTKLASCWVNKKLRARPPGRGAISQCGCPWYHRWLELCCPGTTAPLLGTPQPAGQQIVS